MMVTMKGCCILIGLIWFIAGAASGAAQYVLLANFTKAITGGTFSKAVILLGVFQFFLPLVVLLGCAFLFPNYLVWTGAGMAAALLGCAAVKFIRKIGGNKGA